MSKHNYTNPAFCQSSEFYPVPSANKENVEAIYNRSLQIQFNTNTTRCDPSEGPLRMQRSMSTRSVTIKKSIAETAPAVHLQCLQNQQMQQQQQIVQQSSMQPIKLQNSNRLNESFDTRSGSGRYALVPVEELPTNQNNRYAIVPGLSLATTNPMSPIPLVVTRRYAKSQDDLDRYTSHTQLAPEEPHSFHEDPSAAPYSSLPPILDRSQMQPKRKLALQNRQKPVQKAEIKHAFSSDFGSKTFLIVDKNSNQKYQMVPTAEDEELVDDNQEVIQMHNGKAHRYAMIPTEDDGDDYEQHNEEEETCLSNPDLNRSENFLPRHYEHSRLSMRTSTPQKGASMANLCSYPNTPLKNPQATKMLHELLSTPPRKPPLRPVTRSQHTTPRQMYASQRDLRMHYGQQSYQLQNVIQSDSSPPPPPPPILPRKSSQLSPQRLHYETVKPIQTRQTDRTMAVIQPRVAGSRIHPHLEEEEEEDCSSIQQKSHNDSSYPQKIANAAVTLAIVSLMLVLGSSMNSALIVYMIAHMGKSFYLQFSLVAAISGVGLGFLGFRSRHCEWLPNRSYTSGYILVTVFCLLKCCGLLVILVLDPYPGLPLHDVTTGIILGLSTFTMFFIGLGVIGTLWCYRPPPDNRVNVVKMLEYQREHAEAAVDISNYVSNPINAYLLTKRLTTDWKQVENLMAHDVGAEFLTNITNYRNILKFPSDEDLNGAAVALMRLQDTYNLDTSSLARGELNGIQYSTEMSSDDCFELGRQSYVNHDYYHTVLWMNEAMTRMLDEPRNRTLTFTKADILEYLAFSTYKQGNVESALSMTKELLQLMPNHERATGNKVYYEKELKELSVRKKVKGDDGSDETPKSDLPISKAEPYTVFDKTERKAYELLCQGKLKPSPSQLRSLTCRYVDNNVPFLKVAPLKLEEAFKDPYIVVYHDVIFDSEIEIIKKMARPRFRRATVQNAITGELETANYRISKSAWLKTEEHPIIKNVVQRTEDMTGLDMSTAEELQVVNYGIGGHYEPHFDFARREEVRVFQGLNSGNRIATVLFYMSDVEQGGATVFTAINVAVWPKKGSAAFWYNLHKSGEGDYRTRHAACPVLTGSKWVSNKWIHERQQEFRRPCGLEPDHGEFAI